MSEYSTTVGTLGDDVDRHADLISLLGAAQACDVELLTVTWEPGLELLGRGGTARVDQSQLNRNQGFAFKRMEFQNHTPFTGSYRRIISEILALRAPLVRETIHVIQLEGICWEINNNEALPVLVFPRASHGNLRQFASTSLAQNLSLEDRIELCIDIAKGFDALHSSGRF